MKPSKGPLQYGIGILSVMLIVFNVPCLYADHDTSLRTDLNFSYTFNKQFQTVSYIFLQADDEVSNYDYVEWGAGLQYQTPLTWLSFLAYYQQGYSKDDDRHWLLEQKPSMNMNVRVQLSGLKISNQIRYEYRITPDWNDFRIKNTMEISYPDLFLQPYIGWELFYENRDKAVMLNRIKLGVNGNVCSHVSLGPYYRMDFSNIDHGWEWTRQLIGFQMKIKY